MDRILVTFAIVLVAAVSAGVKVKLVDNEIKPCTKAANHKIISVSIDSCKDYVDGVCNLATNSQAKLITIFEKKGLSNTELESLNVIPAVTIPDGYVVERKEPKTSYKITCEEKTCTLTHDFLIEDIYPKIQVEIDYGLHKRMSEYQVMCFKQPIRIV